MPRRGPGDSFLAAPGQGLGRDMAFSRATQTTPADPFNKIQKKLSRLARVPFLLAGAFQGSAGYVRIPSKLFLRFCLAFLKTGAIFITFPQPRSAVVS